jgi:serine/threonine-protein kinase
LKGDLDTITHKALQFEPSQRYGSAERFAHDLRCFLASRPIAARKLGRLYSLGLFLRRNRAVSIAAAAGAVLSMMGATAAVQQYFDAQANAERAAAVRDFMFEFVNDVEPNESQSAAEITGRQMLDAAVERARRSLRDKPPLQGEVLGELGRMYLRFIELDLAAQTMREGLGILEANVEPDDAALNNTRAQLSGVLLRQNQPQQARALAMQVLEDCRRGTGCAQARYVANTALADIHRNEGRTEQSLQAMREAVREAAVGFGERHTDTTEALGRLAYMLRSDGYFVEAGETIDRAVSQSADQLLRKVERLRILRWKALIEMDLGRYDGALQRLGDLLPRAEGGSERALLLRTIANAHLAKGEPVAALDNVEAAIRLLEVKHSGADLLYTIQVRAQALALLNRGEEALEQIRHVIDQLAVLGRSPASPDLMRAQRIHGEILLRNRRPAEAVKVLIALREQLLALHEVRSLEAAQTLDLLGCAQRELGLARQATEAHEAADVLLKKILPVDHPFLVRNTLYRVAAANDRERFEQQAARIKFALGPSSIWNQILAARTDPSACRGAPTAVCTLVL